MNRCRLRLNHIVKLRHKPISSSEIDHPPQPAELEGAVKTPLTASRHGSQVGLRVAGYNYVGGDVILRPHIWRGFVRLYLVTAVPWLAYFGYNAIDAGYQHHRLVAQTSDTSFRLEGLQAGNRTVLEKLFVYHHGIMSEPPSAPWPGIGFARTSKSLFAPTPDAEIRLGRDATVEEAELKKEIKHEIKNSDLQLGRFHFALTALPIVPLGKPILFFAVYWVAAGFKSKTKSQ